MPLKRGFNFKDVTVPADGLEIRTKSFWLCMGGNPERALFFGDIAQCNKDRRVSEWTLAQKRYQDIGDLAITFIEIAYIPIIH